MPIETSRSAPSTPRWTGSRRKGLVRSRLGEPSDNRGGRAKKCFTITGAGSRALERSQHAFRQMLDGLAGPVEPSEMSSQRVRFCVKPLPGTAVKPLCPEPPWAASRILTFALPTGDGEAIAGDLFEEFQEHVVPRRGVSLARWWYRWQVARSLAPLYFRSWQRASVRRASAGIVAAGLAAALPATALLVAAIVRAFSGAAENDVRHVADVRLRPGRCHRGLHRRRDRAGRPGAQLATDSLALHRKIGIHREVGEVREPSFLPDLPDLPAFLARSASYFPAAAIHAGTSGSPAKNAPRLPCVSAQRCSHVMPPGPKNSSRDW